MSDMREQVPQDVTGTDADGVVTLKLAADGLPERVTVVTDWQVRLRADGLGTAVVEAYETALNERLKVWERSLADSDWERRAERFDAEFPTPDDVSPAFGESFSGARSTFAGPAGDEVARQRAAHTDVPEFDLRYVVPRPLDEVAEEMLSLFAPGGPADAAPEDARQVTGVAAARNVHITVAEGALISCEVDPGWAAGRSAVRLNQALAEALADARGKLGERGPDDGRGVSTEQLDGLFKEALAILNDPARHAG